MVRPKSIPTLRARTSDLHVELAQLPGPVRPPAWRGQRKERGRVPVRFKPPSGRAMAITGAVSWQSRGRPVPASDRIDELFSRSRERMRAAGHVNAFGQRGRRRSQALMCRVRGEFCAHLHGDQRTARCFRRMCHRANAGLWAVFAQLPSPASDAAVIGLGSITL
jgi:hypothetical protein